MFICGVPRDSLELSRVLSVEQRLFGGLTIPPATAHEIFETFPEVYTAVRGSDGAIVAYSSAFPLKREWARAFIAGDISEPDLTPDMLLDRHGTLNGCSVYIGSVVVDDDANPLTKMTLLASLFTWRIHQLRAASVKRLSVFMMPVAAPGERMIRYVGAKRLNDGSMRKDGYPVYGRTITPGYLARATSKLERSLNSRVVQMNLDFAPRITHIRPVPGLAATPERSWPMRAFDVLAKAKDVTLKAFAGLRGGLSSLADGVSATFNADWFARLGKSLTWLVLTTAALLALDAIVESEHLGLAYIIPIALIALRYGKPHAVIASAASVLITAFYFFPPKFNILIQDSAHLAELAWFGALAVIISHLVSARRLARGA